MKYIRTKDELGILIEPTDNEELQRYKRGSVNDMIFSTWSGNDRKHIVKQADTIEELCDEFVVIVYPDEPYAEIKPEIYKRSFKDILKVCEENMTGIQKLYGAIWTDKGLIYVAKMNEKGELELL